MVEKNNINSNTPRKYVIKKTLPSKLKKMKAKFLTISCGILVFASACNSGSESKSTGTDTAKEVPKDTTVAVAPGPCPG